MNEFDFMIGEQLSSVVFVQDYLQLNFDGNLMTFYDWPILNRNGLLIKFPNQEYRNVLCEFIANKVLEIIYIEDEIFEIIFGNNFSIKVDILSATGEVLYSTTDNHGWWSL